MPRWKTLTNKQWITHMVLLAKRAAHAHSKKQEKRGDKYAHQAAKALGLFVEDQELRNNLKEIFKATYVLQLGKTSKRRKR